MREVLRKLEQVQEIDIQINSLTAKRAEFPRRLAEYDQQIKGHTTKYNERKKIVEEIEKGLRQQTGALELNEDRIKRSQEKLELIKTNQEFQALTKEIESPKKNSAVIQENATKVKTEVDGHHKELEAIETAMNAVQTTRDAEAAKIAEEEKRIETELGRLNDLRGGAIVGIDKRYLATYDRVRASRYGIGIVAAMSGSCKGCNMRIPPQMYNELQRGEELHLCPSCKRILIYKEPAKTENPAPATA